MNHMLEDLLSFRPIISSRAPFFHIPSPYYQLVTCIPCMKSEPLLLFQASRMLACSSDEEDFAIMHSRTLLAVMLKMV